MTTALAAGEPGSAHAARPSSAGRRGDERVERGVVGRRAVVGIDEHVAERLGALVHVGHAGRGEPDGEQRQRDRPTGLVERPRPASAAGGHCSEDVGEPAELAPRTPRRRRSTTCAASASRAALTRNAVQPRRPSRPGVVTTVCRASHCIARSTSKSRAGTVEPRVDQLDPPLGHRGERQPAARTSSARAVSWVVPASSVVGHRAAIDAWWACSAATGSIVASGSGRPPTSPSDASGT